MLELGFKTGQDLLTLVVKFTPTVSAILTGSTVSSYINLAIDRSATFIIWRLCKGSGISALRGSNSLEEQLWYIGIRGGMVVESTSPKVGKAPPIVVGLELEERVMC